MNSFTANTITIARLRLQVFRARSIIQMMLWSMETALSSFQLNLSEIICLLGKTVGLNLFLFRIWIFQHLKKIIILLRSAS
jgi:hypothetical protein